VTGTIAAFPLPSSTCPLLLLSSQRKTAEGIAIPMGNPTKQRNQTLTGTCLSSEWTTSKANESDEYGSGRYQYDFCALPMNDECQHTDNRAAYQLS
jgi:hypothetical protein